MLPNQTAYLSSLWPNTERHARSTSGTMAVSETLSLTIPLYQYDVSCPLHSRVHWQLMSCGSGDSEGRGGDSHTVGEGDKTWVHCVE